MEKKVITIREHNHFYSRLPALQFIYSENMLEMASQFCKQRKTTPHATEA
jgi:hypothetical protein